MNMWHDENRDEFRTLMKGYEIYREGRKGPDDSNFIRDIRSLIHYFSRLLIKSDLHDFQKGMKTIKHDLINPPYQRDAIVQRVIINQVIITSQIPPR